MDKLDTKNWQAMLKKAFSELMFMSEEEINDVMNQLIDMPEEAYKEIYTLIQEGKTKQDDLLEKLITKNPDFLKTFKKELEKALKIGAKKIEEKEAKKAETEISDKLQNL